MLERRKSPGRKRLPVEHSSPTVQRILNLVDLDGRPLDAISIAAGLSASYIGTIRVRTINGSRPNRSVSITGLEKLAAELGHEIVVVPKRKRP